MKVTPAFGNASLASTVGARHAVPERPDATRQPNQHARANSSLDPGNGSEVNGDTNPSSIAGHGSAVPLLNPGAAAASPDNLAAESATLLPSIMPDQFADNHAVELAACMRWFSSDAGQVAKIEAPAGYANARAMLHKSYLLKQQGVLLQHPAALLPPRPNSRQ